MSTPVPNPTEFQILLALAGQDRHGYGIIQEISRQSGGLNRMGPGTLYGGIKRMRAAGWITDAGGSGGEKEDSRRTCHYKLTRAGRVAAGEAATRMADIVSIAASLGLVTLKRSH